MAKGKYITTPLKLWQYFEGYRSHAKDNPFKIVQQKRSSAIPKNVDGDVTTMNNFIEMPTERPLTMEGFLNYLDAQNIITDATDIFDNKDKQYSGYARTCARIKREIKQDQIEGCMANIYNPSITARVTGLTTKMEQKAELNSNDDEEVRYKITFKMD